MDTSNIQELNRMKPNNCTARIELLGRYDPEEEATIRDPYYVRITFILCYALQGKS